MCSKVPFFFRNYHFSFHKKPIKFNVQCSFYGLLAVNLIGLLLFFVVLLCVLTQTLTVICGENCSTEWSSVTFSSHQKCRSSKAKWFTSHFSSILSKTYTISVFLHSILISHHEYRFSIRLTLLFMLMQRNFSELLTCIFSM